MKKPDPDQLNDKRAAWAEKALDAFQKATRCEPGDQALADLIADLRHWADREDICWDKAYAAGMEHYEEETADDGC